MPGSAIEIHPHFSCAVAAPLESVKEFATRGLLSTTVGISAIPLGTPIEGFPWKVGQDLVVEIRQEASDYVAIHHAVDEYGIGSTPEGAVRDLLTSLADYRASLEKRRERLADDERQALRLLEMILERQ